VATRPATQRQSEVRQDAALEEGGELLFDKPRRFGASIGLDVGDGAGHMLLDPSVQRGLLGAVAFVGERVAIGRTLGLPASGLHDGVPDGRFGATNSRLGMSLMGRQCPVARTARWQQTGRFRHASRSSSQAW
jgi:hypothetical protein